MMTQRQRQLIRYCISEIVIAVQAEAPDCTEGEICDAILDDIEARLRPYAQPLTEKVQ
jgi:hypothetical protein